MKLDVPLIAGSRLLPFAAIAANVLVLIIAVVNDLSLIEVLLVWCCESVWIALFGALRLIVASIFGNPYRNRWAEVSRGSSLFVSVVVIFLASSTYLWIPGVAFGAVLYAEHLLSAGASEIDDLQHLWLVLGTSAVFLVSHGLSFLAGFLALGQFRLARAGDLVVFPLKRSLALLVSVAGGLVFIVLLPAMASTLAFVLVVVVLKLMLDFWLYREPRASPGTSDSFA